MWEFQPLDLKGKEAGGAEESTLPGLAVFT